jgi:poly-gamma-glutamate synthesis protein (capsule biosynthesis protein)
MASRLILTGDVNLMRVVDPTVPFRRVADVLRAADCVFGNLECCLRSQTQAHANEGFFADPEIGGEALRLSGVDAVGIANNVNYGWDNISASIARLDKIGVLHTGAGVDITAARAPAIVSRNGLRVGAVQRSSVYWPTDHEAHGDAPGIAVIKGHTAYHVPMGRISPETPPANRPGIPPVVLTWADVEYLDGFRKDIEALRPQVDVLIASCHWGLGKEPLQYMKEIAHAAIDSGADIVMGHGPHYALPIEVYKGRPIFYGLGNLAFNTGHLGRKHAGWVGLLVEVTVDGGKVARHHVRFVRSNADDESYFPRIDEEAGVLADLAERSKKFGTKLEAEGDMVRVLPHA